jgi:hypothetical protein
MPCLGGTKKGVDAGPAPGMTWAERMGHPITTLVSAKQARFYHGGREGPTENTKKDFLALRAKSLRRRCGTRSSDAAAADRSGGDRAVRHSIFS